MKLLPALLFALISFACQAVEYGAVDPKKSSVSFISRQMGVPIDGGFGSFQASIAFDPERPEAAHAKVEIDVGSIDAGNPDADDEVRGKGWFDVAQFRTARFEADKFKVSGPGSFEAAGRMTIKGVTQEVLVPFRARVENGVAVLEGLFPISRKQYGLGTAEWMEIVADEVKLRFRFALSPLAK